MDADFQSDGQSWSSPKYRSFFLDQHEVDTFLHEYSDAEQSRLVRTTYEDGVVGNLILMIE